MVANTSWSGQRRSFPTATRQRILARAGGRCEWVTDGVRCANPGTIADHIVPHAEGGTDHESNGQALCPAHHDAKTRVEQARGRARRSRYRPPQQHPGIRR